MHNDFDKILFPKLWSCSVGEVVIHFYNTKLFNSFLGERTSGCRHFIAIFNSKWTFQASRSCGRIKGSVSLCDQICQSYNIRGTKLDAVALLWCNAWLILGKKICHQGNFPVSYLVGFVLLFRQMVYKYRYLDLKFLVYHVYVLLALRL